MASRSTQPNITMRPGRALLGRVQRFAREHVLFEPGQRVLVAVSGGPDSTCLLLSLAALRRSLDIELAVAYFDHRLRGPRASAREGRFVRELAERLGLPFFTGTGDVRAHANVHKLSLEAAARELRYCSLAQAARQLHCRAVATGHTRDDQAETVLMHMIRGSGLAGLAGMTPLSPWPMPVDDRRRPRLVRPLLCLTHADTEAACREAGVTPLTDPTNRSRAHKRNRIRRELLPLLRRENPRVDDALAQLAASVADDLAYVERQASRATARLARRSGTEVRIDRRALLRLPPALQSRVVQLAAGGLSSEGTSLSSHHIADVLSASARATSARLDLPRGLRVEVRRDVLVITAKTATPTALPARGITLPVPGRIDFGPWRLSAEVIARPRARPPAADANVAWVDVAAASERLTVRRRRAGDRFQPLGMAKSKKLQDFFVDEHVARSDRDGVPLVCGKAGVLWVAGHRITEWAKVRPGSRRIVRLRAERLR